MTSDNRWLDMPGWNGSCIDKAAPQANVEAVIIDSGIRDVFALPEGRRAIIEFLYHNMRRHID